MPCSVSNWTIELNALPEGSRPTRVHNWSPTAPSARVSAKTFDTDWIENGSSASPAAWTVPSASTTAIPNLSTGTEASGGM